MINFKRIFSLIKKELLITLKDPKSRGIILGIPLVQLLIFANAISMEVKNIDVAVLDKNKTHSSSQLISKFEASERFRHIYYMSNEQELKKSVDLQKVQMGLIINSDFEKNIKAQKPTEVGIITDGRQTNNAGIIGAYANLVVNSYNEELFKSKGAKILIQTRNWYNPNLEYRWYILTILICLLGTLLTLILTALSIAREREMGTFDQLIVSPLNEVEILIGKTVPPLVIALVMTSVMSIIIINFFKVPFSGSFLLFFISILLCLLAIVGVGLFISSISKNQQQAILGIMTFQTPAVLLSGFISPINDMPQLLQSLTMINPLRYFIATVKGIFLKGMNIEDALMNLIPVTLIALFTLSMAYWTFKRKLD